MKRTGALMRLAGCQQLDDVDSPLELASQRKKVAGRLRQKKAR